MLMFRKPLTREVLVMYTVAFYSFALGACVGAAWVA